jgi:hypothetical protein
VSAAGDNQAKRITSFYFFPLYLRLSNAASLPVMREGDKQPNQAI